MSAIKASLDAVTFQDCCGGLTCDEEITGEVVYRTSRLVGRNDTLLTFLGETMLLLPGLLWNRLILTIWKIEQVGQLVQNVRLVRVTS